MAAHPENRTRHIDPDLLAMAVPGHGVPSQDLDVGAQLPMTEEEARREAHSAFMGGGLIAGTAAGAAMGAVVAGPVGVMVGCVVGAMVGGLCGAVASWRLKPDAPILQTRD